MIKVRVPSLDAIKLTAGEIVSIPPSLDLEKKYEEALEEIKRLQTANPSAARQLVKHITVDKIVDNPDLIKKIAYLEDQVSHLESARLSYQTKWMQSQTIPSKVEVKIEEKIVEKLIPVTDWTITFIFSIGCFLSGLLVGKIIF